MDWQQWMSQLDWIDRKHYWVLEVFAAVFLTLLANFLLRRLFSRLEVRLQATVNRWDDVLLEAARKPAAIAVWVVGLAWAGSIVDQRTDTSMLAILEPLRDVGVILLLSWFLIRLIRGVEGMLLQADDPASRVDETTAQAIGKLLRASVIITSVLVILQSLGYSISGVLAFGGIGGIAVGFAAKDLLANFFGGLMVYLDRPFVVGEWIRSPDKEIEGTVEYIGWRQTRIRTFDKRPLYVPNATFASIAVENPSRMTNRRIYETVGVRYDDAAAVKTIVDQVREMLRHHADIDTRQTLIVNLNRFGPSSLDFFVYAFTRTTNWVEFHGIKEDVMLRIMAIIEQQGAEIAYPTTTIHVAEIEGQNVAD